MSYAMLMNTPFSFVSRFRRPEKLLFVNVCEKNCEPSVRVMVSSIRLSWKSESWFSTSSRLVSAARRMEKLYLLPAQLAVPEVDFAAMLVALLFGFSIIFSIMISSSCCLFLQDVSESAIANAHDRLSII